MRLSGIGWPLLTFGSILGWSVQLFIQNQSTTQEWQDFAKWARFRCGSMCNADTDVTGSCYQETQTTPGAGTTTQRRLQKQRARDEVDARICGDRASPVRDLQKMTLRKFLCRVPRLEKAENGSVLAPGTAEGNRGPWLHFASGAAADPVRSSWRAKSGDPRSIPVYYVTLASGRRWAMFATPLVMARSKVRYQQERSAARGCYAEGLVRNTLRAGALISI